MSLRMSEWPGLILEIIRNSSKFISPERKKNMYMKYTYLGDMYMKTSHSVP